MATKRNNTAKPSARKLVGAVILTASFSFVAIPDALAESGGCASVSGAMGGSVFGSSGLGGCLTQARIDTDKSVGHELEDLGGY